ncbi:uncharacterized protein ELE39_002847 [Cryptosporidium sp. chipmunk genotype I]|uniref:uncharacterized protein n=1 Tax=Cryptosporidium sp. chipmunk genotype I TaxID=1280935 RepID=UPI00351A88A8|nr:hypothetical protein ELE39_002847 [Cryptosporidium sp. chipmunk genotype I]
MQKASEQRELSDFYEKVILNNNNVSSQKQTSHSRNFSNLKYNIDQKLFQKNSNEAKNCECIINTDRLVELLNLKSYLDFEKKSCCRDNCKMNGIYFSSDKVLNGWSRYPLKMSKFEEENVKNWDISYHGTTHKAIKSILKDKRLVIPNNKTVYIRKGHIPNQYFIFTSPSLLYASFGLYSAPFKVKECKKWWQIVVEIVQKPNSYVKEWETSGLGDYEFDKYIGNYELEWKSDQEMGNLIKAVLVREIKNIEPPICQYPVGTYFLHDDSWWYQPYDGSTPFCPSEISSNCNCYLKRGARIKGSICPIVNYRFSQFRKKQICTSVEKYLRTFPILKSNENKSLNNFEKGISQKIPVRTNQTNI